MISVEKWAGLVTNASPYALPPGSAVTRVNLQCISTGQLNVRPGTTSLTFTTHSGSTLPIVKAFRYPRSTEQIVYQNNGGKIIVGKGPA